MFCHGYNCDLGKFSNSDGQTGLPDRRADLSMMVIILKAHHVSLWLR